MAVNVAKTTPEEPGETHKNSLKVLNNSVIQKAIENLKENIADGFQWHDIRIYVGTMAIAIEQSGVFFAKSGKEKQGLLVDILSNLISIPFIPNVFKKWFFKWAIRKAIKIFNKKGWDTKHLK